MVAVHLAIDEVEAPGTQLPDEMDDRHLGGVAAMGEHGFGEEGGAERDAVYTACQAAFDPCLGGMCEPQLVQNAVCAPHRRGNPRPLLSGPRRCGARMDDASEGSIEAYREHASAQRLPQAAADVQVGGYENRTRVGRKPQERPALAVRPGKKPLRVGEQQPMRAQVAAVGHQAVGVGFVRVRERQAVGKAVDWHEHSGVMGGRKGGTVTVAARHRDAA